MKNVDKYICDQCDLHEMVLHNKLGDIFDLRSGFAETRAVTAEGYCDINCAVNLKYFTLNITYKLYIYM